MWRNTVAAFFVTAFAAELAGLVAILIATLDLETAGLGLLVPISLIPSALLYLGARSISSLKRWKDWAYWVPVFCLLACMLVLWLGDGEGSGFAVYMAIVLTVAAGAAFATLRFLGSRPLA